MAGGRKLLRGCRHQRNCIGAMRLRLKPMELEGVAQLTLCRAEQVARDGRSVSVVSLRRRAGCHMVREFRWLGAFPKRYDVLARTREQKTPVTINASLDRMFLWH